MRTAGMIVVLTILYTASFVQAAADQTIGPPVFAGIFGARSLICPNPNNPGADYTMLQHQNDSATYDFLQYKPERGWGFEALYQEPDLPYGLRGGAGRFGPLDDSPNYRNRFSDNLPDQIYDSFIGTKNFLTSCQSGTPEAPQICSPPEGCIFRIDLPNGWYRFVGVFGDADNPHVHRVLAEDGGTGPPEHISENYVTLVHNHDQAQYNTGQARADVPGAGVFARVGFALFLPPEPADPGRVPVFVDMDENGRPTVGRPKSPALRVTQGYIRIHLLQGDSNNGLGGKDPDPVTGIGARDPSGADVVLLEVHPVAHEPPAVYVDAAASGADNGLDWANAYVHLQDALKAASSNPSIHEIRVAEGTYKPDENAANPFGTGKRKATFQLISGVAVYGGFPSGGGEWSERDPKRYETILSGNIGLRGNEDNSYNVVTGSGTDPNAVLDGFTISGGNANGTESYDRTGGGMYNQAGSATVTNCTFSGNSADGGGGGMCNWDSSNPTVTNCTFSGNSGGGMSNRNSSNPTVTNCTFSANSGGGMFNAYYSTPTLINCTFSGNTGFLGSGMSNDSSDPTLINCTFSGNSAENNGGGMANWDSSNPTLINCTFSGNSANEGGGMTNFLSSTTLINCTFSGNSAVRGGGMVITGGNTKIANCILWGNTASSEQNELYDAYGASTLSISRCAIAGYVADIFRPGLPSPRYIIEDDPLFVDADGADNIPGTEDDDLRLSAGSPCIDAGNNNSVLPDTVDLDGDGDTTERTPLDLAGNARFTDDPLAEDTGVPAADYPEIVEIGAYERHEFCGSQAYPYPPGDVSGPDGVRDCFLDFYDFAVWAAHWMEYTGPQ